MYHSDKLADLISKPVETDPTYQHLMKAASLIRKHGLAKDERQTFGGSMCIHGAIAMAVYGNPFAEDGPEACAASTAVYHILTERGVRDIWPDGVAPWNNEVNRTQDEVVEVLETAALQRALALRGDR